jgi:hypothetical protein
MPNSQASSIYCGTFTIPANRFGSSLGFGWGGSNLCASSCYEIDDSSAVDASLYTNGSLQFDILLQYSSSTYASIIVGIASSNLSMTNLNLASLSTTQWTHITIPFQGANLTNITSPFEMCINLNSSPTDTSAIKYVYIDNLQWKY